MCINKGFSIKGIYQACIWHKNKSPLFWRYQFFQFLPTRVDDSVFHMVTDQKPMCINAHTFSQVQTGTSVFQIETHLLQKQLLFESRDTI